MTYMVQTMSNMVVGVLLGYFLWLRLEEADGAV
jgi:hypothetical protein